MSVVNVSPFSGVTADKDDELRKTSIALFCRASVIRPFVRAFANAFTPPSARRIVPRFPPRGPVSSEWWPLAEDRVSIWSLVAGAAAHDGARQLPDVREMFAYQARVLGSDQFGVPRLPAPGTGRRPLRRSPSAQQSHAAETGAHQHSLENRWSCGRFHIERSLPLEEANHRIRIPDRGDH